MRATEHGNGRIRFSRLLALVLFCTLCLPGISASVDEKPFASFIEKHANGWIDWDQGLIYGIGRGYLGKNRNNRPLSQGVAGVLASGSIVKLASGIHLDDASTLESLGSGAVTIKLEAFLKDKEFQSEFVDDGTDPYYEVIKVARMRGVSGLTAKLLKHFDTVPTWRDFPIRPLKPRAELDDKDQPWLVLDARHLADNDRIEPAMFPKIVGENGETVYELSRVEEAALVNRGMMRYVVSDQTPAELRADHRLIDRLLARAENVFGVREARAQTVEKSLAVPLFRAKSGDADSGKRKKRGRYIVADVQGVQGLAKTNLVISARDAMDLKAEDSASKILRKCRVLVIVSSPIGGIEGSLPAR
ncbi:MAG: hypothetical protein RQ753_07765, partial [Desulfurivibrionaceae bacterium]|nr:hypothetical protein [Desulfurivibrionaceae bacterium]